MRKQQFFPKFADREAKAMVKFTFQPTIGQSFSTWNKGLSVTEDPLALCLSLPLFSGCYVCPVFHLPCSVVRAYCCWGPNMFSLFSVLRPIGKFLRVSLLKKKKKERKKSFLLLILRNICILCYRANPLQPVKGSAFGEIFFPLFFWSCLGPRPHGKSGGWICVLLTLVSFQNSLCTANGVFLPLLLNFYLLPLT